MSAHVLVLAVEVQLPESRSRKDKLGIITPLFDSVRERYNASVAEVDLLDIDDRAGLRFACVSGSTGHATGIIDKLERFVWSFPDVDVVSSERIWAELP